MSEAQPQPVASKPFPAKVAKVIDPFKVVINRGADDGVKVGQRFLVYGFGDDIVDPDTRETLGRLEIVRGTGVATHVQSKLAILNSEKKEAGSKRIVRSPTVITWQPNEETFVGSPVSVPFEEPVIGDLAKPV